jgi:hypothetical protein
MHPLEQCEAEQYIVTEAVEFEPVQQPFAMLKRFKSGEN